MKVLVTGAEGFLGKNLCVRLQEHENVQLLSFTRQSTLEALLQQIKVVDFIFHLAGVNRPSEVNEFNVGNADLTRKLCEAIRLSGRTIPVLYASSIQVASDNPYGRSKLQAEQALVELHDGTGNPIFLFRLPNIFGKWCRPNYNSVVATFCHNLTRGLPIQVNDPSTPLNLVYIDDVVAAFIEILVGNRRSSDLFHEVSPRYSITLGELADQLKSFGNCRTSLVTERVGLGLTRALYATYISYLPVEKFHYDVPQYGDPRGVFVEMLKTQDAGQFSFFTAHPGITRGGHYHHSKTEKFLVIRGRAHFRFRHLITGQFHEIFTDGETPQIVETIPGWAHDITNVGDEEMIVMLWANEIFDRARPDTIARPL